MKTVEGLYKRAQVQAQLLLELARQEREPQVLKRKQQAQERRL